MTYLKRSAIALLLVALACTAWAQPQGWTNGVGNKHSLDAVAADPVAIERVGSLGLDLDTLTMPLVPWSDADNDEITATVYIPPGSSVGAFVEVPYGFKAPLANHFATDLTFVDLDFVNSQWPQFASILEGFNASGIAAVFGGIDISAIPNGEWRIPKIVLGGSALPFTDIDISAEITEVPAGMDGFNQPEWSIHGVTGYHNSKRNNVTGVGNYTTGKLFGMPRPVLLGWRNNAIVYVKFGSYEYETSFTKTLDKVFDGAAILAEVDALANPLTPTSFSMSADLGYSTEGAVSGEVGGTFGGGNAAPIENNLGFDVTVDSIHWFQGNSLGATTGNQMSIHLATADPQLLGNFDYLSPAQTAGFTNIDGSVSPVWDVQPPGGVTTLVNGARFYVSRYRNLGFRMFYWDTGGPTDEVRGWSTGTNKTGLDVTGAGVGKDGLRHSMYVTVTGGGGGGGTTDNGPLNLGLGLGF